MRSTAARFAEASCPTVHAGSLAARLSVAFRLCCVSALVFSAVPGNAQQASGKAQLIWGETGYPVGMDIQRTLVAVDSKGGALVMGSGYAAPDGNGNGPNKVAAQVAVKLRSNGSPAWTSTFTPLTTIRTWVTIDGLALDGQDNAYAVGTLYNPTGAGDANEDIVVQKVDSRGRRLWSDTYDAEGEFGSLDVATGIALDGRGGAFVLGTSQMLVDTTVRRVLTVIHYSSQGERLWVQHYADSRADVEAVAVCADRAGGFYAVGNAISGFVSTPVALRYNADGSEAWEARPTRTANTGSARPPTAIDAATDRQGGLYVVVNALDGGNSFTCVRYGQDGRQIWAHEESLSGNRLLAVGLGVDPRGNVAIGSTVFNGRSAYAVTVIGPDGRKRWTAFKDSRKKESLIGSSIAVDAEGNVYVTGLTLASNGVAHKQTTVKFDPAGGLAWVFDSGSQHKTMLTLPSISVNRNQEIAITGIVSWPVNNLGASVVVKSPSTNMVR